MKDIEIDISVLSEPKQISSYKNIEIGKHGVVLKKGDASAVFLPQVPTEWNWGITELMENLSLKAGLDKNAYKSPDAFIEVFEAEVFSEEDFMRKVKKPDVAGMFYPSDKNDLQDMVYDFVESGKIKEKTRAIIVPHAGYVYSGEIAGSGYKALENNKANIKTVVIMSPCHNYAFDGVAYHSADYFETPIGEIAVDKEKIKKIASIQGVNRIDEVFENEHSLEVQIPFIQYVFHDRNVKILPLVVGKTEPKDVKNVVEKLWNDESVGFVISTDLSHFNKYQDQQKIDSETIRKIENLEFENLKHDDLCGYYNVRGFLEFVREKGLHIQNVARGDSSIASGDKSRVVGYAAFILK
jgi:AmmeMemoRadiSam system protein B